MPLRDSHIIILLLLSSIFSSCRSDMSLQEARIVVEQADSVMFVARNQGRAASIYADTTTVLGDSLLLAQTVTTLSKPFWRPYIYADEYAHAQYHYGRLLREQGDYVAAMWSFIEITHSITKDHIIRGRAYSNIGSIAHLEGDFSLSYSMYQNSSAHFLQAGDSLMYYSGIYRMAYELATIGSKDSCLSLLGKLTKSDYVNGLYSLIALTHIELYIRCKQYDTALYYIRSYGELTQAENVANLQKAQTYSALGYQDSAVYYAIKVANTSSDLFALNNSLYILVNDDSTKNTEEIKIAAAKRADVQKQIEIRQRELSHAISLLRETQQSSISYILLGYIVIIVCVLLGCVFIYAFYKRLKIRSLAQRLDNMHFAEQEMQAKNEYLINEYHKTQVFRKDQIELKCNYWKRNTNFKDLLKWYDFDAMCTCINQECYMLVQKLQDRQILNRTEIRLCVLVFIGFKRNDIAQTLPYSLSGIGKLKDHTAKKLNTTGKNLHTYLVNLAIEG